MSKYLRYNFLNMAQMYTGSFAPYHYPLTFQTFPILTILESMIQPAVGLPYAQNEPEYQYRDQFVYAICVQIKLKN